MHDETDPLKDGIVLTGMPVDHHTQVMTEKLLAGSKPHVSVGLIGGRNRGLSGLGLILGTAAMSAGLPMLGGLGGSVGSSASKPKSYTRADLDRLFDARVKLWKRAETRAQQSGLDLAEVLAQSQFEKLRSVPDWAQQHNLSVRYFDGSEIRWSC